jgi:branched-chain amino acid transport system permease protein
VTLALQLVVDGLASGALYALIALGFALIYNATRMLHLAHGAVFAFGGFTLYACSEWFGLPLAIGFVAAVLAAGALGAAMEVLVYRKLRERDSKPAAILVASLGLLIFCQAMYGLTFGTDTRSIEQAPLTTYTFGGLVVTQLHLIVAVVALVIFPVLHLFLVRTQYGRSIRALADNPSLATVFGVDKDRIYIYIFFIGSGLAAIAAGLISFESGVRPTMGFSIMFIALVAVIIGGIGYLPGAAAGGILVGLLQNLALWPLSARWQDIVVFGVLIALLLIRPQGLFGSTQVVRRA